jgi:hypothetical protein
MAISPVTLFSKNVLLEILIAFGEINSIFPIEEGITHQG